MRLDLYTILGLFSILFWSTTFGFSRMLNEKLGIITTVTSIYLISGIFSCLFIFSRKENRRKLLSINFKYLIGCGALFIIYAICVYSSVGLVNTRQQVIEVGLINYLWPSLTIIFSIFLLKKKARIWVIFGIILATAGIYLAGFQGAEVSAINILNNLSLNWLAYLLALLAAISWGLYSNLTKLWGSEAGADGIPIFLLATGIILFVVKIFIKETSIWDIESITGLIYMSIFPTFLGYQFWDKAMQKGDMILVASFSYFTPLFATIFSCFYLGLNCGWLLGLACGLVLAGSVICKLSVKNDVKNRIIN